MSWCGRSAMHTRPPTDTSAAISARRAEHRSLGHPISWLPSPPASSRHVACLRLSWPHRRRTVPLLVQFRDATTPRRIAYRACPSTINQKATMSTSAQHYQAITGQATVVEAGGLARERAVLLLWFLRNIVGIDELTAYDHVCDGDNDKGIDGLFLERATGEDKQDTIVIYQSKYTTSPNSKVGPKDIDRLAGAANYFYNRSTLQDLLNSGLEPSLLQLIRSLNLDRVVTKDEPDVNRRLVMITTGKLNGDAQKKVRALRAEHGNDFIDVWDVSRLGKIAESVRSPDRLNEDISVCIDPGILIVGPDSSDCGADEEPQRGAVLPVRATEIASWPGIENRQLFALNVRHELRSNRVSKALDDAISRHEEHKDFLFYHNGLTIICDAFEQKDNRLIIKRPSVVNGAQSVLAFCRAADKGNLTNDLHVFVKVVEVRGRPTLEKEVARRSNTQTGVSPRNLMANHGTQLRLQREFKSEYPSIYYETRPDTQPSTADRVISNDAAAQLICAIYNAWPWLAVKRTSLFDPENHPQIFSERIHAHHILFADRVRDAVQHQKDYFPDRYRESWLLTRLVACYLVGQIIRRFEIVPDLYAASAEELEDSQLLDSLEDYAYVVAAALHEHHDLHDGHDDFKRDFKNESQLKALSAGTCNAYRLSTKFATRNPGPL